MMKVLEIFALLSIARFGNCQICNVYCDGRDPSLSVDERVVLNVELFGRQISLHISDQDNMGFAEISNGDPSGKY